MIEQEVIAACKNEMFKRFPRSQIVIGRPASLSQYDKAYMTFGLIVKPFGVEDSPWRASFSDGYTVDVKAALVAAAGAWFDMLRDQGSVLVVRRALEWSQHETPDDRWLFKITMRAHADNHILEYKADYALKTEEARLEDPEYQERMRAALA